MIHALMMAEGRAKKGRRTPLYACAIRKIRLVPPAYTYLIKNGTEINILFYIGTLPSFPCKGSPEIDKTSFGSSSSLAQLNIIT